MVRPPSRMDTVLLIFGLLVWAVTIVFEWLREHVIAAIGMVGAYALAIIFDKIRALKREVERLERRIDWTQDQLPQRHIDDWPID